jgi:hypothetical protein
MVHMKKKSSNFSQRIKWSWAQTHESPKSSALQTIQRVSQNYKRLSEKYLLPIVFVTFFCGLGAKQIIDGHFAWALFISIIGIGLLVIIFIYDFLLNFRQNVPLNSSTMNLRNTKLMPSTQRLLENSGANFDFAAGSACEFIRHPYIGKRIIDNGWNPKDFLIEFESTSVDLPDFCFSGTNPEGNNSSKYVLLTASQPMSDDSEKLRVKIAKTSWYDVIKTRDRLSSDEKLRHQKINETITDIGVTKNLLPSSFCLHFVCLLARIIHDPLCLVDFPSPFSAEANC